MTHAGIMVGHCACLMTYAGVSALLWLCTWSRYCCHLFGIIRPECRGSVAKRGLDEGLGAGGRGGGQMWVCVSVGWGA